MILRVRCNQPTFRTVEFTEGLNIVLAVRTKESTKHGSRNSIGKSTLIEIINFCLCGKVSPERLGAKPVRHWTFTLDLLLGGKPVSISRTPSHDDPVIIEGDTSHWPRQPEKNEETGLNEMTVENWTQVLRHLMVGLPIEETHITNTPTFRGVISYFVRKGLGAYLDPLYNTKIQDRHQVQILNSFLLGLDWEYAREWKLLKDKEEVNRSLKKATESGALEGVAGTLGELKALKVSLAQKAHKQEERLNNFKVHEDYEEIGQRVNELTREMHNLANKNVSDTRLLNSYKASGEEEKPPSPDDLIHLYEEAKVTLPKTVKIRLEQVKEFHIKLIKNRRDFLKSEIDKLAERTKTRRSEIVAKSQEKAELMEILRTHGALKEYTRLQQLHLKTVERLKEVEYGIENLKNYQEGKVKLKKEEADLFLRAEKDLEERQPQVEKAMALFSNNVAFLYEKQKRGTFIIEIDEKKFLKLYPDIEGAADDGGVAKMRVFCYDVMLAQLWSERKPSPGFLIHDSVILDGVDERQRAFALQLIEREARERGFQYILTLNSDIIPKGDLPPDFNIDRFVRLELTDDTDAGSLLGIGFHSRYLEESEESSD